MRLVALGIVILAGAVMAGAGAVADALPGARQYSQLPTYGLLLVGAASTLFTIEWWSGLSRGARVSSDTTAQAGAGYPGETDPVRG